MSADTAQAKRYWRSAGYKFSADVAKARGRLAKIGRPEDAAQSDRVPRSAIQQFCEFRKELARLGAEVSPAKGREWGDNDANRERPHRAEHATSKGLAALYDGPHQEGSMPSCSTC